MARECKSLKININARSGEIGAFVRTGESIFYVAMSMANENVE